MSYERAYLEAEAELDELRTRLAEVEAERDQWKAKFDQKDGVLVMANNTTKRLMDRLAAVEALCDKAKVFAPGGGWLAVSEVRAAARGEGERRPAPPTRPNPVMRDRKS